MPNSHTEQIRADYLELELNHRKEVEVEGVSFRQELTEVNLAGTTREPLYTR
jgi:hypothetical protein